MRRFYAAALGGGISSQFIVDEGFEGTGLPSGWTTLTGTPNYDYTAAPIVGAQSLYLSINSGAHRTAVDFTDMAEVWIYLMLVITNGSAPGASRICMSTATNGSTTLQQSLSITTLTRLVFSGQSPTNVLSIDTPYHVWLHYKQGSGANAAIDIGFSTTGVRPSSGTAAYAATTSAAATNLVGRVILGVLTSAAGYDVIYDKVRVASSQIGDNGSL